MANMKFSKGTIQEKEPKQRDNWKVLIVDDEKEVHTITKSVLEKFIFERKGLDLISAFSAKEAYEIIKENDDIALILLDVVMETDDAGLVLAKLVRKEIKNHKVRIVLRTGQPGSAPEKDVILNYDINDYKEKTELTSTKLFTSVVASLRSFRDINTIEKNRVGLEKIIVASKSIFKVTSTLLFVEGVLTQLVSILNLSDSYTEYKTSDAFFATLENHEFKLLASTGKFQMNDQFKIVTPYAFELLDLAYIQGKSFFKDDSYVGIFKSSDEKYIFLYLEGCKNLNDTDKHFINLFSNNISIAFENICLNEEVIETQKEIVERLGEVVESRSHEAANHVNRVATISYNLAVLSGMKEEEAYKLKFASPMHDVGKIGIADSILLKPGKFEENEFEKMKKHAQIGYDILKGSKREILQMASIVAYEHHEKWDGSGYPRGLKGEDIHIYGRITAIADVYDALTQKRIYKEPWPQEKVIEFIKDQSGKHFDPHLVEVFLNNYQEIIGDIEDL
jgi:response regulator RpfG family c-di-GMP phosphodiesterase